MNDKGQPDEPRELEPINGKNLPGGFPDSTIQRAIELLLESRSVAQAYTRLKAELEARDQVAPAYQTVWTWAKAHEEVIGAIGGYEKGDMVSVCSDAAMAWAGRMIDAAESRKEDGSYVVPDTQVYLNYGTTMDKRTNWERGGGTGQQMNVQFNLVTRKPPEDKGDNPDSE